MIRAKQTQNSQFLCHFDFKNLSFDKRYHSKKKLSDQANTYKIKRVAVIVVTQKIPVFSCLPCTKWQQSSQTIPASLFSLCYPALMSTLTYSLSSIEAYKPAWLVIIQVFLSFYYYYSTFPWHLDLRGLCGHKTQYITEACHIITQDYPVIKPTDLIFECLFSLVQMQDWSTCDLYTYVGFWRLTKYNQCCF